MKTIKRTHAKTLKLALLAAFVLGAMAAACYLLLTPLQKSKDASPIATAPTDTSKDTRDEMVMISLPGAKPFPALKEDYTQPSSIWMLVNKQRSISLDFVPPLLKMPNVATRNDKSDEERSIRSDIIPAIDKLFEAAATYGHSLLIGSAYRSAALQKHYFDHYAQVAGEAAANKYSAHPGESEHQTGLSIDITSTSLACYLDECFADTADGKWIADNAYKYGFILRYPKGKETITGYQFEPWHYRYVSIDLATALHESNLTLDEAWPYLEAALKTLKQRGAI